MIDLSLNEAFLLQNMEEKRDFSYQQLSCNFSNSRFLFFFFFPFFHISGSIQKSKLLK